MMVSINLTVILGSTAPAKEEEEEGFSGRETGMDYGRRIYSGYSHSFNDIRPLKKIMTKILGFGKIVNSPKYKKIYENFEKISISVNVREKCLILFN